MKQLFSAGGIIVRLNEQNREVLLLKDMNNCWTFPKGIIEKGESKENAALREIQEEVSLTHVQILSSLQPVTYQFRNKRLIQKTVYYFVCLYSGHETPIGQKKEGIKDVRWYSFQKARSIIGYKDTNLTLLHEAETAL